MDLLVKNNLVRVVLTYIMLDAEDNYDVFGYLHLLSSATVLSNKC